MTRICPAAQLVAVDAQCIHVGHKTIPLLSAVGRIKQRPGCVVDVIRLSVDDASAEHDPVHALSLRASIVRRHMTERQPMRSMLAPRGPRDMALKRRHVVEPHPDLASRLNRPHRHTLAAASA